MRKANDFMIEQLQSDSELRKECLKLAINTAFGVDDDDDACDNKQVGLLMLRDLVNATCGFEDLARRINASGTTRNINPKTIMHVLSERGNPGLNTLIPILNELKRQENMQDMRFGEPEKEIAQ